jgi:putative ABC transport system permease protein
MLGFVSTPEMPMFMFGGLEPDSSAMKHYKLVEGRTIQRPNEIMLGKVGAATYKVGVGDTMQVLDNRYKVVGIFETGVAFEDASGMLALREAQRLMGRPRAVTFIFVDVAQPSQAQAVVDAINRRFPEARASISSEFAQSTNDLQTTLGMMEAIRWLALFVGGIVVANTMIMSIFERTREIGTLRALGWRPRRIIGQILLESLFLCIVAAVLGSLIGVGLFNLATMAPMSGAFLSAAWNVEIFASAFLTAGVLGILGGLFPAWRASRLEPAEALRYE